MLKEHLNLEFLENVLERDECRPMHSATTRRIFDFYTLDRGTGRRIPISRSDLDKYRGSKALIFGDLPSIYKVKAIDGVSLPEVERFSYGERPNAVDCEVEWKRLHHCGMIFDVKVK